MPTLLRIDPNMSIPPDNLQASIQAGDVATFLNQNRTFFHVFPNLLDELSIPHPKSGQEISLLERQVHSLREQRDSLQVEVDTLKDIAGENGVLLNKVYQLGTALMAAETDQQAIDVVYNMMNDVFTVEQVSMMSWSVPNQSVQGINQLGISQSWSEALKTRLEVGKPVCGLLENDWQKGLFSTAEPMASACIIPLGENPVWGVLALGSTTDRFHDDLGTYFLKVMGQFISSRLNRLF